MYGYINCFVFLFILIHPIGIRELVAGQLLRLPERFQVMLRMAAAARTAAKNVSDTGNSTAVLPPATISEPKTSVVHAGDSTRKISVAVVILT